MTVHEWGTAPDFIGPRHELREQLLLDSLLEADPGRRVLNVGAGQGTFTNRLAEQGFEVVSTELGQSALQSLRARVGGEIVEADATELPFAAGSFDLVVLGEVLEHIDDDIRALCEAARVLSPNGVLAVSVPRNPKWFSESDRWAGHRRRYTRDDLTGRVEASGFHVVTCRAWGFPVASLYHRTAYDRAVRGGRPEHLPRGSRLALGLLALLLRVDRLFVGVERGALGYLLIARRKPPEQ